MVVTHIRAPATTCRIGLVRKCSYRHTGAEPSGALTRAGPFLTKKPSFAQITPWPDVRSPAFLALKPLLEPAE